MATTYLYLDRNSYDANVSMCGNVQNTNSVGAFDNTTYATLEYSDQVGNQNFTWWKFNSSTLNIPSGSTITNVSCDFKCAGDFTNMGTGPGTMQLYYGNDDIYPKGDTADFTQNDYSTFTITQITNSGDWTISELNNVYLKVFGEIPQGITTLHFYGATLTIDYTEPVDYEIGTGAWYSKIGGSWKEIYKMYYKVGNAWKEVAYAYRKQDNTWYSIGERKLLFEADLISDLSYHNYLDGTTGNMSWYYGSPTYSNNMLQITTRSDNNFRVYLPLTSSANPQLRAFLMDSTKEHWFTVKTYIDSWGGTNYQWAFECGFSTNANSYTRDGSIFNMHQVNGPYYTRNDQSGAPYAPAGATIWQKTNLTHEGYLMHYFNATPGWTVSNGNSNTNPGTWYQASRKTNEIYDTTRATWNHSGITGMGWGASSGANSVIRMSTLKIWSSEPTNTEIGI